MEFDWTKVISAIAATIAAVFTTLMYFETVFDPKQVWEHLKNGILYGLFFSSGAVFHKIIINRRK